MLKSLTTTLFLSLLLLTSCSTPPNELIVRKPDFTDYQVDQMYYDYGNIYLNDDYYFIDQMIAHDYEATIDRLSELDMPLILSKVQDTLLLKSKESHDSLTIVLQYTEPIGLYMVQQEFHQGTGLKSWSR